MVVAFFLFMQLPHGFAYSSTSSSHKYTVGCQMAGLLTLQEMGVHLDLHGTYV